jgi:hypothetical protein
VEAVKNPIPPQSNARDATGKTMTKTPAGREPAGVFIYTPIPPGRLCEPTVVNKMLAKKLRPVYLCI